MPSLQSVVANIPGLAGYEAARLGNREGEMQQVQQAGALQQLFARQQAAQQEQAFRQELMALGPNPDQGALAQLAAKYASPSQVLSTQQASLDRAATRDAAIAGRDATVAASRENAAAMRDQRMQELQMRIADRATASSERAALMKELQQMRVDAVKEAAASRQPSQVTTDTGIFDRMPDGKLRPVIDPNTNQQAKPRLGERPVTEFQGKNALYGSRAFQADAILKDLEEKISTVGLATKQSIQGTPVIGGILGAGANVLLSANQQSVEQAQRNFVNAVLRQESGAVISDPEFENAKKQYFPQPGDSKQVIEQKRQNRKTAIQGFKKIAGPAWNDAVDAGMGDVPEFANEAAAAAAGLKPGTRVKIGGKTGTWQ